jgi:hypothetical protein
MPTRRKKLGKTLRKKLGKTLRKKNVKKTKSLRKKLRTRKMIGGGDRKCAMNGTQDTRETDQTLEDSVQTKGVITEYTFKRQIMDLHCAFCINGTFQFTDIEKVLEPKEEDKEYIETILRGELRGESHLPSEANDDPNIEYLLKFKYALRAPTGLGGIYFPSYITPLLNATYEFYQTKYQHIEDPLPKLKTMDTQSNLMENMKKFIKSQETEYGMINMVDTLSSGLKKERNVWFVRKYDKLYLVIIVNSGNIFGKSFSRDDTFDKTLTKLIDDREFRLVEPVHVPVPYDSQPIRDYLQLKVFEKYEYSIKRSGIPLLLLWLIDKVHDTNRPNIPKSVRTSIIENLRITSLLLIETYRENYTTIGQAAAETEKTEEDIFFDSLVFGIEKIWSSYGNHNITSNLENEIIQLLLICLKEMGKSSEESSEDRIKIKIKQEELTNQAINTKIKDSSYNVLIDNAMGTKIVDTLKGEREIPQQTSETFPKFIVNGFKRIGTGGLCDGGVQISQNGKPIAMNGGMPYTINFDDDISFDKSLAKDLSSENLEWLKQSNTSKLRVRLEQSPTEAASSSAVSSLSAASSSSAVSSLSAASSSSAVSSLSAAEKPQMDKVTLVAKSPAFKYHAAALAIQEHQIFTGYNTQSPNDFQTPYVFGHYQEYKEGGFKLLKDLLVVLKIKTKNCHFPYITKTMDDLLQYVDEIMRSNYVYNHYYQEKILEGEGHENAREYALYMTKETQEKILVAHNDISAMCGQIVFLMTLITDKSNGDFLNHYYPHGLLYADKKRWLLYYNPLESTIISEHNGTFDPENVPKGKKLKGGTKVVQTAVAAAAAAEAASGHPIKKSKGEEGEEGRRQNVEVRGEGGGEGGGKRMRVMNNGSKKTRFSGGMKRGTDGEEKEEEEKLCEREIYEIYGDNIFNVDDQQLQEEFYRIMYRGELKDDRGELKVDIPAYKKSLFHYLLSFEYQDDFLEQFSELKEEDQETFKKIVERNIILYYDFYKDSEKYWPGVKLLVRHVNLDKSLKNLEKFFDKCKNMAEELEFPVPAEAMDENGTVRNNKEYPPHSPRGAANFIP